MRAARPLAAAVHSGYGYGSYGSYGYGYGSYGYVYGVDDRSDDADTLGR